MALRDNWIEQREAAQASSNGSRNMSQMHLARLGVVSEEIAYVAKREKLDPDYVRGEVAGGRAGITPDIPHPHPAPLGLGGAVRGKIKPNNRHPAATSRSH